MLRSSSSFIKTPSLAIRPFTALATCSTRSFVARSSAVMASRYISTSESRKSASAAAATAPAPANAYVYYYNYTMFILKLIYIYIF